MSEWKAVKQLHSVDISQYSEKYWKIINKLLINEAIIFVR